MMSSKQKLKPIVYCHTNKLNGKCYVGVTCKTMEARWGAHVRASKRKHSGLMFLRALEKYGTSDDVWEHKILETAETFEVAKELEKKWISLLCSYAFDENSNGYNMTRGGDGTLDGGNSRIGKPCPWNKRPRTKAEKENARIKSRGRKHTPEEIEKQIKAQTGKKFSEERKQTLRKPKSEIGRQNIALAMQNRFANRHPLVIELLQQGLSIKEIETITGKPRKVIQRVQKRLSLQNGER